MALAPISSLRTSLERKNRIRGIEDFENYMHRNPGAAPGGTGNTGLAANDAAGWSKLLERQQQYLADKAELEGKAGPTVRFAGYSGGTMASQPNPAMAGLRAVATKGREDAGGGMDDLISQFGRGRSDIGTVRALREAGLMPQFDAELGAEQLTTAKHAQRRARMTPADLYGEKQNARLQYDPAVNAMERQDAFDDDISESQAASDNYWRRGMPIKEDQHRRDTALAVSKGEAATLDDMIRADASRYSADSRLSGQRSGQQQQALAALMSILQRESGSARQYGDDARLETILPQLDALLQGGAPGTGAPAQPRTGAPGAGAMSQSPEIADAIRRGMAEGYSREEVEAFLRQNGQLR